MHRGVTSIRARMTIAMVTSVLLLTGLSTPSARGHFSDYSRRLQDNEHTQIRKTDLSGSFKVKGMSKVLVDGFCRGSEFLYIKIQEAPDHAELL